MEIDILFSIIQNFLMAHPIGSPFIYVLTHIVLAVAIIPCSPMTVIAGAIWGKWVGLLISIFSASLSSFFTFFLSRRLFRDAAYRFFRARYPKTDWLLAQTQKHGWKFVALVQLNPLAPASTLGYLFGLTRISFPVYAMFTLLFMIPLQVALVFLGDAIPELKTKTGVLEVWGGIALLCAFYFLYKLLGKKIQSNFKINDE